MYLGIEIGGTKLQLGIGPGHGVLEALWRGTVDVRAGGAGIRRQIVDAVPDLLAQAKVKRTQVRGVGIGFGGPVDDVTRCVIKSHQIDGWDGFPLADWIAEMLGWPAALGNDADVAGLAEALFGAGQGLSPVFYITIGSGIGGGLIIDGHIYRGCGRGAAEIGHLQVPQERGQEPSWVSLEELVSGWAIQSEARRLSEARVPKPLYLHLANGQRDQITAENVALAAAQGEPLAVGILNQAWSYLAGAICAVIALCCPRRFIIGGGVAGMGEQLLFQPLRRRVAERVFKPFADCFDIVPATLGEAVVVQGALALARQQFEGKGNG